MLGTLINVGTVVAGSCLGMLIKGSLPDRMVKTVFNSLGIFTLFLGIWMSIKLEGDFILIVVLSLVIGSIIGEAFLIEQRLNLWLNRFNSGDSSDKSFSEGLLTAFLLFCMGSMTLLGTFQEGISGNRDLLITKATMDFFSATALASAFGKSVLLSAVPLLIFQGALTLGAVYIEPYLSLDMQSVIFSIGGIVLVALGLNILEVTKIRILNIMPAIIICPFLFKVNELMVHFSF